jgi:hypothetical protein
VLNFGGCRDFGVRSGRYAVPGVTPSRTVVVEGLIASWPTSSQDPENERVSSNLFLVHQSHLNNFRPKVISEFPDVRTIAEYRRRYPRNLFLVFCQPFRSWFSGDLLVEMFLRRNHVLPKWTTSRMRLTLWCSQLGYARLSLGNNTVSTTWVSRSAIIRDRSDQLRVGKRSYFAGVRLT